MENYRYTVILQRQPEGGFHVFCPALPGCHSEGDSVESSVENIMEAIEVYLESLRAHGEEAPHEDFFIKPVEVTV